MSNTRMCWNYNSHIGCEDATCAHANEFYRNAELLTPFMRMVLAKRGGFKKEKRIPPKKVSDSIRDLRLIVTADKKYKLNPTTTQWVPRNPNAAPATRVAGDKNDAPREYVEIDHAPQEDELRRAVGGPGHVWAETLPQEEQTGVRWGKNHPRPASEEGKFSQTQKCATIMSKDRR